MDLFYSVFLCLCAVSAASKYKDNDKVQVGLEVLGVE